jgi:hypothetical protein
MRQVVLSIPIGYSNSPGSYEGCLGVNSGPTMVLSNLSETLSGPVQGKYCTVNLKPPQMISAVSGGGMFEQQNEDLDEEQMPQSGK